VGKGIPGDFTFDSWFTCAENLNHIDGLSRTYVGDLKFNRKVQFQGRQMKAQEVAARIEPDSRKLVVIGDLRQWVFTKSVRIPSVDHKVRIVILWDKKDDKEAKKILVTNRVHWDLTRILRVYRYRWTGTECFHRDGKQHVGMGDCQLRSGQGQTRHLYMVFLAYSILMRQLRQGRASAWAMERLTTIGQACMAVLKDSLSQTVAWILERIEMDHWDLKQFKVHLALT